VAWLPLAAHGLAAALTQGPGTSITPLDSTSESITGYVLSFGLPGVIVVVLAYLLFRGYRLVSPGFEASIRDAARADARADLIAERDRIITEKQSAEDQRDEALQVARDQLLPLLVNFTAATQALLPILQGQVAQGGRLRRGDQKW
jgi:hypothetical protein